MDYNKAIVITGTSTGIGKACALHLDKVGFKVYAGVRKQADGALEVTPVAEIHKLMEVNVIGLMAMTQAFIPMLRKGKGRIINIGSTSSLLAFPGASAYSASKFAVRAITDSLRLELKPFGMSVILVAPGAVESKIWDKGKAYKEKLRKTVKPEIAQLYAPLIKFGDKLNDELKKIPADEVAKSVAHAFTSKKPKRYYIVGNDAKGAAKAAKLPKGLLDWIILKRIQKLGNEFRTLTNQTSIKTPNLDELCR